MPDGLRVSNDLRREMLEHVSASFPEEACGLLVGTGSVIEKVFPVTNICHSSTAFRMDAEEQFKIMTWQEEHHRDLLAIYHSHPQGPSYPSPRDLDEFAYPGSPYLMWSIRGRQWQVFGFMINHGKFARLQLHWT
jgi:[CysO sulfur-carrier protein]-S-L-cysteine hydrolase